MKKKIVAALVAAASIGAVAAPAQAAHWRNCGSTSYAYGVQAAGPVQCDWARGYTYYGPNRYGHYGVPRGWHVIVRNGRQTVWLGNWRARWYWAGD